MARIGWMAVAVFLSLLAAGAQAQDTGADCTLTFDAVWSAANHPTEFPPDPHFSPLIGGSHHGGVSFWEPGVAASAGIQAMAEFGSTGPLTTEVNAAIQAGTAAAVISGGAIGLSPGQASAAFRLETRHPLISVVTMIAPSPDWFVGVHGLSLFEGGSWIAQRVVALPPYDAGTDSGMSFTSSDAPTVPRGVIAQITGHPFGGPTSLGTFTVDCTSDLIFTDGFESGDSTVWSTSQS